MWHSPGEGWLASPDTSALLCSVTNLPLTQRDQDPTPSPCLHTLDCDTFCVCASTTLQQVPTNFLLAAFPDGPCEPCCLIVTLGSLLPHWRRCWCNRQNTVQVMQSDSWDPGPPLPHAWFLESPRVYVLPWWEGEGRSPERGFWRKWLVSSGVTCTNFFDTWRELGLR